MKAPNLPSQLPFLPGNTAQDPKITRYHKTQQLQLKDGTCLEKTLAIQEDVDEYLLEAMREGRPLKLAGIGT